MIENGLTQSAKVMTWWPPTSSREKMNEHWGSLEEASKKLQYCEGKNQNGWSFITS